MTGRRMDGKTDGREDGWTDGREDGWTGRRMDRRTSRDSPRWSSRPSVPPASSLPAPRVRPAVASPGYHRGQRRREEPAQALDDGPGLEPVERCVHVGPGLLPFDGGPERHSRTGFAHQHQRRFRASPGGEMEHQGRWAAAQPVLDSAGIAFHRESFRPFSEYRHGNAADGDFTGVPGVLVVAGPLLGSELGRGHVLSVLLDDPGEFVYGGDRHGVDLERSDP